MTDKNVNPDDNQADDNQAGENVEERFADIVDGVDIDADQPTADSQAAAATFFILLMPAGVCRISVIGTGPQRDHIIQINSLVD